MSIFSAFNVPFSSDGGLSECGDSFGIGSRGSSIPWDVLFLFGLFTAIVGFLLAHWWLTVRMRKYQDRIRVLDGEETTLPTSYQGECLASEYDDSACSMVSTSCVVSSSKPNEPSSVLGKRSRDVEDDGPTTRLCYADLDAKDAPPIKKLKITEEPESSDGSKEENQPQTSSDPAPKPMDVDPPTVPSTKPVSKKGKTKKNVAFASETSSSTPALEVKDTSNSKAST